MMLLNYDLLLILQMFSDLTVSLVFRHFSAHFGYSKYSLSPTAACPTIRSANLMIRYSQQDEYLNINKWQKSASPSLEELFSKDGVEYLNKVPVSPLRAPRESNTTRILPLMPFESPLFLGSREFLYIYEMRFRNLMNYAEKHDDELGRCYTTEHGDVGAYGSLCKIVEKKKMEDGKGFFIIEATNRFKIIRIVQVEPVLMAEVEMNCDDDPPTTADTSLCEHLCQDVYTLLKIYLRLNQQLQKASGTADKTTTRTSTSYPTWNSNDNSAALNSNTQSQHDANAVQQGSSCISFQPAVHRNRPRPNLTEQDNGWQRHQAFSHACANVISTEPAVLQQIFQSPSVSYRLHGVKRILAEAIDELSSLMIDDGSLSKHSVRSIISRSTLPNDSDDDLLPAQGFHEVTLADEVIGDFIQQNDTSAIGLSETSIEDLGAIAMSSSSTVSEYEKIKRRNILRQQIKSALNNPEVETERSPFERADNAKDIDWRSQWRNGYQDDATSTADVDQIDEWFSDPNAFQ